MHIYIYTTKVARAGQIRGDSGPIIPEYKPKVIAREVYTVLL